MTHPLPRPSRWLWWSSSSPLSSMSPTAQRLVSVLVPALLALFLLAAAAVWLIPDDSSGGGGSFGAFGSSSAGSGGLRFPARRIPAPRLRRSIEDVERFLSTWTNRSLSADSSFPVDRLFAAAQDLLNEHYLLVAANNLMKKEIGEYRFEGDRCVRENDQHVARVAELTSLAEYHQQVIQQYEQERLKQENLNFRQLERMKQIQELVRLEKQRLHDEGIFVPPPDALKRSDVIAAYGSSIGNGGDAGQLHVPAWKTYNESTYQPFEIVDLSLAKKCDDGLVMETNPCPEDKDPGEENPLGSERYLMYQPMGRFNNQHGALRNAIYLAKALNRILVVPRFSSNGICIYCNETSWHPPEKYFDIEALRKYVPIVSIDAFRVLVNGEIPKMLTLFSDRHSADRSQREYPWYFEREGFHVNDSSTILCNWKYISLTRARCMLAPYRNDKIIALNLLFYKIKISKEDVSQLAQVVSYNEIMDSMAQRLLNIPRDRKYLSLHIRRGDFEEYCVRRHADSLQHCYPSAQKIVYAVNTVLKLGIFRSDSAVDRYANEPPIVFVSTDSQDAVRKMFENTGFDVRMINQDLIDERVYDNSRADDNVAGIMDQIGSMKATYFIGNMFSSFSKVVIENRGYQNYTTW